MFRRKQVEEVAYAYLYINQIGQSDLGISIRSNEGICEVRCTTGGSEKRLMPASAEVDAIVLAPSDLAVPLALTRWLPQRATEKSHIVASALPTLECKLIRIWKFSPSLDAGVLLSYFFNMLRGLMIGKDTKHNEKLRTRCVIVKSVPVSSPTMVQLRHRSAITRLSNMMGRIDPSDRPYPGAALQVCL